MAIRSLVREDEIRRRSEFAALVRMNHISGSEYRNVGREKLGLSEADIDQGIADAFNPRKSLPGCTAPSRPDAPAPSGATKKGVSVPFLRSYVGMKMYPNDPAPRYPRWVVAACVVLSILGFIYGCVRWQ